MSDNPALQWIKSHIVLVICAVVILAALIGGPIVSDGWNQVVAKEVSSRLRTLSDLDKNAESEFQWPGDASQAHQVYITQPLLEEFKIAADARVSQTGEVVSQVQGGNQMDTAVVMPELFPVPANMERDLQVLPPELHRRIVAGYDAILLELHAGDPPTTAEVQEEIKAKRDDFVDRNFMKGANDSLDAEEEKSLREYLTTQRLAFCRDRANEIGVYLSKATLEPPTYANTQKPSLAEMFTWQWRLWTLERVASAIAGINGTLPEPLAPIHRIDQIAIRGLMDVETPAASARSIHIDSGGRGGGGGGGGIGGGGGGMGAPPGGGGGMGAPPGGGGGMGAPPGGGGGGGGFGGGGSGGDVVPVPPAGTRDYARSITGRVTNSKFDVILVDLDMIVSLDRIDEVLDGLTIPVVMSVVDLEIGRVDAFEALGHGEYLGEAPVARLVVTVETLWLRAWSQDLMPDETRVQIGIPARVVNEGDSGGPF